MSIEISAAIVGGAIAVVGALAGATVPLIWALRYDRHRNSVAIHEQYLSWLRALKPECEHIVSCIDEIQPLYQSMLAGTSFVCPTKRLNSDFLASARLGIMNHARSSVLFPPLTKAYRDVVNMDDMMDRFESAFPEAVCSGKPKEKLSGIVGPTIASLSGVRASVTNLLNHVLEQQQLESDNKPKLFCCF